MKNIDYNALFPFRGDLSAQQRELLGHACELRAYAAQEHVDCTRAGALMLVHGAVCGFAGSEGGREAVLFSLEVGEVYITPDVGKREPLSLSLRAICDSEVIFIERNAWCELLDTSLPVCRFALKAHARFSEKVLGSLHGRLFLPVRERVVQFLLLHAAGGEVRVTHGELAAHLGTVREPVSRVLGALAADGIIATGRGRIRILDPAALGALCELRG